MNSYKLIAQMFYYWMLEQKISISSSPKVCAMPSSKETKSASCCFCTSFAMSFFMYATLNLFIRQLQHPPHLFRILLGNITSNTFTIHLLGGFAVFHYFSTQGHIESIDCRYNMCHVLLNFLKAQPQTDSPMTLFTSSAITAEAVLSHSRRSFACYVQRNGKAEVDQRPGRGWLLL